MAIRSTVVRKRLFSSVPLNPKYPDSNHPGTKRQIGNVAFQGRAMSQDENSSSIEIGVDCSVQVFERPIPRNREYIDK